MVREITRRRLFRSTLAGGIVTLGLPILDMTLNEGGRALAATGAPLPVRFGTWHWGCGMNPDRWVPTKTGADWEITPELQQLAAYKKDFNLYSGYSALLDGRANAPHISAVWALRTGTAPRTPQDLADPSLDILIARQAGGGVRFRTLDMAATGAPTDTYSCYGNASLASPDPTPLALYTRVFGPGFQDPNAAAFTPDPDVMLRQSVLSSFADERAALLRDASAGDRQKLDAYFTSVRELEQQLALQTEKPAPCVSCEPPKAAPAASQPSTEVNDVSRAHKLMVDLTIMALQCHQTKVFNIVFSPSASTLRKEGSADTHHMYTHEEAVDSKAGYQVEATSFSQRSVEAMAYMISKLKDAKEGDASLLDNVLVYAHSDTSFAKEHSLDELPVLTIGRAGGRIKTGLHIREARTPVSKTGLTAMHAMGVRMGSFGTGSMQVTDPIHEVLV